MLHVVSESDPDDVNERKQLDEAYVVKFFQAVQVSVTYVSVARIGKPAQGGKIRPIKVIMHNENDKNKVMDNLSNLKDNKEFNKGL